MLRTKMIATRYTTQLGRRGSGCGFDPDKATSHIVGEFGQTLCGITIGRRIEHGGKWETSNWPDRTASCKRCQARRHLSLT